MASSGVTSLASDREILREKARGVCSVRITLGTFSSSSSAGRGTRHVSGTGVDGVS